VASVFDHYGQLSCFASYRVGSEWRVTGRASGHQCTLSLAQPALWVCLASRDSLVARFAAHRRPALCAANPPSACERMCMQHQQVTMLCYPPTAHCAQGAGGRLCQSLELQHTSCSSGSTGHSAPAISRICQSRSYRPGSTSAVREVTAPTSSTKTSGSGTLTSHLRTSRRRRLRGLQCHAPAGTLLPEVNVEREACQAWARVHHAGEQRGRQPRVSPVDALPAAAVTGCRHAQPRQRELAQPR
jgi:hypothetical protein